MSDLIITPRTHILEMIEAYPMLEELLISMVPAFSKLKNPMLRKTVARIATVQQAAAIGNIRVEDLVNRLRKEVGQDLFTQSSGVQYQTVKPEWFSEKLVKQELDVRSMLDAGDHPVNQVLEDLKNLSGGSIYRLIAPFLPAPLIDKATSVGAKHWLIKENEEHYIVYFMKK